MLLVMPCSSVDSPVNETTETSSFVGRMTFSTNEIAAAFSSGLLGEMSRTAAGSQPGDPAKAAAAILTALAADRPPLRLALGDDAVDAIREHLRAVSDELTAWEAVGRATNLA